MSLRDIFQTAVDILDGIDMARREITFSIASNINSNSELNPDEIKDSFSTRKHNYIDFLQKQTCKASIRHSDILLDKIDEHGKLNSWKDYFSMIHEATNIVQEECKDEKGSQFISQLKDRTGYLENYYNKQPKEMKELLDIYSMDYDIYELCLRTPDAIKEIDTEKNKIIMQKPNI